jgi:hypothetical protein
VNDGKGHKAIEENPFLKIWATKLSSFRVTEFGYLDNVRKKGQKTEFRSGPDARTSPRLSEESKLAAKRKVEELESDPLTLFKKMSDKEKLDMVKDLISSKKAKERDESEEPAPATAAKMDARPYSSRPIQVHYIKKMLIGSHPRKFSSLKTKNRKQFLPFPSRRIWHILR